MAHIVQLQLQGTASTSHRDYRAAMEAIQYFRWYTQAKLVRLTRPVVACNQAVGTAAMIRAPTPLTFHNVCLMTMRYTPSAFSPDLARRLCSVITWPGCFMPPRPSSPAYSAHLECRSLVWMSKNASLDLLEAYIRSRTICDSSYPLTG
jgi:hypothetical protein